MKESKFVEGIIENPKKSLFLGILLSLFIAAGLGQLKANFSYRIWFNEDQPELKTFDEFEKQFGSDEMAVVILRSKSGVFDLKTSQTIIDMTKDMWQTPDVIRVDSLSNFNWTHAEGDDILVDPLIEDDIELTQEYLNERKNVAVNHKSIKNYLTNSEGTLAIFYLKLKPFIESTPDYEKVSIGLNKIIEKYKGKSDHEIFVAGSAVLNQSFKDSTQSDMMFLVPMVIGMAIVFLFINLKSIAGVFMSLLIIFASMILTMGAGGWFGITLNNITAIVPQFMIAIGIADSVHILVSFYGFRKKGMAHKEAVHYTLRKNLRPTLLTSLSTAFGFYSFASAGIPTISMMGVLAGTGTLIAWVITYLFLGPLMIMIPNKDKVAPKEIDATKASDFSYKAVDKIYKFRFPIIITFAAILVTNIYFITKIEVNSDPVGYFAKDFPIRIATDVIEESLGGAMGGEIVIDSGKPEGIKDPVFLNKVAELQDWVDQKPYISKTVSIVDILRDTNKSLNGDKEEFYKLPQTGPEISQQLFLYTMSLPQGMDINDRITIRNDKIKMTTMWTLHNSEEILSYGREVEAKAKELGLNAHITGKGHLWQTTNGPIVESFIKSFTIAVILISILLCFGLGSIKIGLFSMIPNTLPLFFGGGMIALLGKYLDIGTVIVGSICLGIAVDDTIHFVANFIKYIKEGKSMRESMAQIFTHTAPALITTTMVLVASFGTFLLGTFVPNQNFGLLVAIVLTFAVIADLLFLPALLFVVGEDFFKAKNQEVNDASGTFAS